MELETDGTDVRGRYSYGTSGRAIPLVGVSSADALELTERTNGAATGTFTLRRAPNKELYDPLVGTWTDGAGKGRLPVGSRTEGDPSFSPKGRRRERAAESQHRRGRRCSTS